ncbi:MAG: NAD(P)-dependent oxidoreductase [Rhodoglobus sp.]
MNTSTDAIEVGFIGLGLMGSSIARRLATQGNEVHVFDVSPQQVATLEKYGCHGEASAAAASRRITGICVPNGAVMRSIIADADFVASLAPGSVVLDFSTVDPDDSRWAEKRLAAHGVRFVDTPVGRTPDHAIRGELLVMAGSQADNAEPFAWLLAQLSSEVHFCGSVGLASTMKLVNNLCNQSILFSTLEAINFSRAAGLDDELVFEVLTHTNADNGHLRNTIPARVFTDDYDGGFKLALAYKDIALAILVANRLGAALPASGSALQAAALAMAGGQADSDSSAYFRWLSSVPS